MSKWFTYMCVQCTTFWHKNYWKEEKKEEKSKTSEHKNNRIGFCVVLVKRGVSE